MQSPSPIATTRLRTAQRLLVLLVAVLGMVVATTAVASASTVSQLARSSGPAALPVSETRVGVARFAAPLFVGLQQTVSPGHVEQMCPRFLQTVSGSCVATKPGASSLDDVLMPGGSPLGVKGTDVTIREVAGGLTDAEAMFKRLSQGGKIVQQTSTITRVELPNGGFVQIRTTMSKSPKTAATIDLNIPGYDIDKIKFNP